MPKLDLDLVQTGLRGSRLRGPFISAAQVGSTNDEARQAALAGAAEGAVFCAEAQTAGRGRQGRQWFATPGHSLLFSVLLRPVLPPQAFALLTTVAGVAVAEACAGLTPAAVGIKWPNDILVAGRKLAGILVEARVPDFAVLGIGINVLTAPHDLSTQLLQPATSLALHVSALPSREIILADVLNRLDLCYDRLLDGDGAALIARQRALEVTLGRRIVARLPGREVVGRAIDLADDGALIIQTVRGLETIHTGEVIKISPAGAEGWA